MNHLPNGQDPSSEVGLDGASRLINEVTAAVQERLKDQGAGHGMDHVLRVHRLAQIIRAEEGGDSLVIELAALLHDVGDAKFHQGIERSGEFSREILVPLRVAPAMIDRVVQIVDQISFRKRVDRETLSLEAKIVQDADRLEAIGAIGIVRTIEYGAAKRQPFYVPRADELGIKTGMGHFEEKLFRLRDLLNTPTARKLAEERHEFMYRFVKQFLAEVQ